MFCHTPNIHRTPILNFSYTHTHTHTHTHSPPTHPLTHSFTQIDLEDAIAGSKLIMCGGTAVQLSQCPAAGVNWSMDGTGHAPLYLPMAVPVQLDGVGGTAAKGGAFPGVEMAGAGEAKDKL